MDRELNLISLSISVQTLLRNVFKSNDIQSVGSTGGLSHCIGTVNKMLQKHSVAPPGRLHDGDVAAHCDSPSIVLH